MTLITPPQSESAYYEDQAVYWRAQGKPMLAGWCQKVARRLHQRERLKAEPAPAQKTRRK